MKKHFFSFAIVVILAATCVISALVFGMDSGETAPVVLPDAPQESGNVAAPQDDDGADRNVLDISPENVQTAIRSLERPESYFVQISTYLTASAGTRETLISMWVSGEKTRSIITSVESVKNILTDGGKYWIWYTDDTESIFSGRAEDKAAALAEALNGLPDYTAVLALAPESITDAGYTEFEGVSCIYAAAQEGDGLESRYYISVENGLLKAYSRLENGEEVFSLVSEFSDLSPDESGVFELPS